MRIQVGNYHQIFHLRELYFSVANVFVDIETSLKLQARLSLWSLGDLEDVVEINAKVNASLVIISIRLVFVHQIVVGIELIWLVCQLAADSAQVQILVLVLLRIASPGGEYTLLHEFRRHGGL